MRIFAALWTVAALLVAGPLAAWAQTAIVVPTRTIPVGSVVSSADLTTRTVQQPPAADIILDVGAVVGKEVRRTLYLDRAIRDTDIGPITLVRRNDRVVVRYSRGPIELTTFGRAMEQGGMGQIIRVMNLDSRRTVYGRIAGPEIVDVGS